MALSGHSNPRSLHTAHSNEFIGLAKEMSAKRHLSFNSILLIGNEECYERKELYRIVVFQLSPVR